MLRRLFSPAAALSCLVLAAPVLKAQVPSALLREGDLVPGTGDVVSGLNNTAVNHNGGYAATVSANSAGLSLVWGTADGSAPAVLRTEGLVAGYEQTSFESFFGMSDDGSLAYSPSATDTLTLVSGLDGVWLDDDPFAVEEQVYPSDPLRFWSFGSRPGITGDGSPYWVGGVTDTQGGSTQDRGLFLGTDATPVIFSGDPIPGAPGVVTNISFDCRFSALGTNYIAEATMSAGTSNALVINGSAATVAGGVLVEDELVPVEAGGQSGEAWVNFDFAGITEDGLWMITGDTSGPASSDEFLSINGSIVHREGDLVDGQTLTGAIEGAHLNEDGDYAYIWDIVGDSGSLEALFLRDRFLLAEGDPVDWDGDGMIDEETSIDSFTGISSLTLSDRNPDETVDIYFTADINVPASAGAGTEVLEAVFKLNVVPSTTSAEIVTVSSPFRVTPTVANSSTGAVFEFAQPVQGRYRFDVVTAQGRLLRSWDGVAAGEAIRQVWDGREVNGRRAPSGIYFVRYRVGDEAGAQRMVWID